MAEKKIIIIGAGLTGLSTAWHLQRRGLNCQVFEKEKEVGGLCRSKEIGGFTFDYDGHLLHFKQPYTFKLIKSLLGDNLVSHARSAWIYAFDQYGRYPFQANLHGLPTEIMKECLLDFIQTHKNGKTKKKDLTFLDWINKTFGKSIARHFMIPYNSKFWTVPPQELTCEWLDGFIPVPSLSEIIEGAVKDCQRQFGYNAQFWYFKKGGINQLPLSLAHEVKNIYTDCAVKQIDLEKQEIKLASGSRERFDLLISTLPLPEMPYLIKDIPKQAGNLFKKLKWNSIFNLNLGIERKDTSKKHWVYFPEEETCFFRVGFPHNFSSSLAPANKSSLYAEVSYSEFKPIDKSSIVLSIERDLKKVGILAEDDRVSVRDINDIKYGYPIYNHESSQIKKRIFMFLNTNNIIPCGRYGTWRYMSMEDSVLEGKKVADIL